MHRGPNAIDARWVFRAYAVLAGISGFVLFAWGPMWFGAHLPGLPWGRAALIRVFGAMLIAAAFSATGFTSVHDPRAGRRGLFWLAVGHTVLWLAMLTQTIAIWGPGLAAVATQVSFAVVWVLFGLWQVSGGEHARPKVTGLFGNPRRDSADELRSRYEQQIREAARLEERNRLARDLHDSVKQQLFVIQTAAATAQARFDGDQPGAKEALEQVRTASREAMTEMQAMLDQLHSVPLENTGLIEAINRQCEALGFRTGAHVELQFGTLPPVGDFAPGAHEAILRAAQEALANVGRHARATSVRVSLAPAHGHVELKVEDNGAGFDANQGGRGQGIANMRGRAEEFGGYFELASRCGSGTCVVFAIPYVAGQPPERYYRKAVVEGALLVFSLAVVALSKEIWLLAVPVLASVNVVRHVRAYRRHGQTESVR